MNLESKEYLDLKTEFPMFAANIERTWGSKEFITYMKNLLSDIRLGNAMHFRKEITEVLEKIYISHDGQYPDIQPTAQNSKEFQVVVNSFPAIANKLKIYWGCKEFSIYIENLLHDNRGDNRKGFPFETLMALHALAEQHEKEYGNLAPKHCMWVQSTI